MKVSFFILTPIFESRWCKRTQNELLEMQIQYFLVHWISAPILAVFGRSKNGMYTPLFIYMSIDKANIESEMGYLPVVLIHMFISFLTICNPWYIRSSGKAMTLVFCRRPSASHLLTIYYFLCMTKSLQRDYYHTDTLIRISLKFVCRGPLCMSFFISW